jgi:hypothetical protein
MNFVRFHDEFNWICDKIVNFTFTHEYLVHWGASIIHYLLNFMMLIKQGK